jgi:hypothetical protein
VLFNLFLQRAAESTWTGRGGVFLWVWVLLLAAGALAAVLLAWRSTGLQRWVRLGWSLVVVAGLGASIPLGSAALRELTRGRAARHETLPWLLLAATVLGVLWFRRAARKPPGGTDAVRESGPSGSGGGRPRARDDRERTSNRPAASTPGAGDAPAIFLSYRRTGTSDVTGRIYDRLVQDFPPDRVFKDVDSIPLGLDFREHLADSVSRCRILLAVIGRDWLEEDPAAGGTRLADPADFVRIEIEAALERGIPVVPVIVQGAHIPAAEALPESLRGLAYRQGIAVRPDPDFHPDMERLIRGIREYL